MASSKSRTGATELESIVRDLPPTRGFLAALQAATGVALIAEVKKASPSEGLIRADFDPGLIAKVYADAGADALSILTDRHYFQGAPENLALAREVVSLPLLRKDFIDDEYQLLEARAWGADAVLLIVAALSFAQLSDLHAAAVSLSMDVLVEVHTTEEVEIALDIGAPLIGVNNRDLTTFKTDLATSEILLPLLASHALSVSESGLAARSDVARVVRAGASAVLIGTTFCAAPSIGQRVSEVMGW